MVLSQTRKDDVKFEQIELEFRESNKKTEQKIDKLTNALVNIQDLILKNGRNSDNKVRGKSITANRNPIQTSSATTIYHNALQPLSSMNNEQLPDVTQVNQTKRVSSSSEEDAPIDTSDELFDLTDHENVIDFVAGAVTRQTTDNQREVRTSQLTDLQPSM